MNKLDSLHHWHQTKIGLVVFGLLELAGAYLFGSWAIDSGSWWDYLLAFILLLGGVQNLVKSAWYSFKMRPIK